MALLWCDIPDRSQGLYGTNSGSWTTEGLYASFSFLFYDDPDPEIGSAGKVMGIVGSSGDREARFILPAARTEVGMGCRVYLANIPIETDRAVAAHVYRNASNVAIISVVISTTGSIQIRSGDYKGTILAETAQDVITAKAWRHLESEITFNATTGTAKVWLEGVQVLDATSLNTGLVSCAQVAWKCDADGTNGRTNTYYKDIFVRDGEGSTNNSQIGPTTVYLLRPNADVSSGWTRSSGFTDFELLDEAPPNDTDYISAASTLPSPSIMDLSDLPSDVVSVRGLISVVRAIKTDSGDGKVQVSLSPDDGATWDTGADNAVTTTESYYHDVSELSSGTASAWTPTEVNNATIRINRTI